VSTDHTARLWDAITGQSLATLPGPWFMVGVGWSPDGASLAACDLSQRVLVYRVAGREVHRRLSGHGNGVQCVAAHPHRDRIATGADDHGVFDWDLTTARPSRQWSGDHSRYVTAVAYSPDGSLLATGAGDGTVLLRDAETGDPKARLTGHNGVVPALAFNPSGRRLASGDGSGRVIVWDVATGRPLQQLQAGPSSIRSLAFLDGGRALVSAVADGPVVLFDLRSGEQEAQIALPGGLRRFVAEPARERLILAFSSGELCSLSMPDLTPGHRLERAHPTAIESLALSPDGRLLATGGADRRVVLRDPSTFEPLLAFPEWTGMVKDLAFTTSGRRLAYVGADSDIALWDLNLLHEGLQAAGLAWDQPAPAVAPTSVSAAEGEHLGSAVPVIRPGTADPTALKEAHLLVQSGVAAFEGGRRTEAIRDLRQARDALRPLHQAAPGDGRVASELGISLGYLGAALREEHRSAEALEAVRESRRVLEAIRRPTSLDLYNLACAYARLSIPDESGTTTTSAERAALADRAMDALRGSLAAGMSDFASIDHDLDPLRGRPDFHALILDRAFPADPFAGPPLAEAGPSSPAPAPPTVGYGEIGVTLRSTPDGILIADVAAGGPAARDGRLRPGDTLLGVVQEPEVLFAGRPLTEVYALLGGNAGTDVRVIVRPKGTDRREVYQLTRDPIAVPSVQVDADGAFELDAVMAKLHGQIIRFEARGGRPSIGWWEDAGEWVSWDVRFDRPGRYDVRLELATTYAGSEFIVEIGDQKLAGKATSTDSWTRYRTFAVGRVEIKSAGLHEINVRAKVAASWNPINLSVIRLTPTGRETKPK
jgi:WD40 repeat protein